jgi:hypothetical protein
MAITLGSGEADTGDWAATFTQTMNKKATQPVRKAVIAGILGVGLIVISSVIVPSQKSGRAYCTFRLDLQGNISATRPG